MGAFAGTMGVMAVRKEAYLKELKRRAAESHVYRKYQLIGLEVAQILGDSRHKALYIRLAKESGTAADRLLRLAKDVAERTSVRNKGAYFMSLLPSRKKEQEKSKKEK